MVLEHALKPFVQNSKPSWCPYHPHYIQFVRERARYGPVEVQNGIAKKQLLSTLKIICKYVYDDIFAAISLKQAFWRARHLNFKFINIILIFNFEKKKGVRSRRR